MLFVEFVVELVDFVSGLFEGAFSGGGNSVDPASSSFDAIEGGTEKAGTFESMQKGIKRAWSDAVAMVLEFLHHGKTEDGLMGSVKQHMDADEAIEEFAFLIRHENNYKSAIELRLDYYRNSI